MKRIYVALILLLLSTLFCTFEFIYISQTTDKYTKSIELIEKTIDNENYNKAEDIIKKTVNDWNDSVSTIDMLLYHDYIDDISYSMASIPKYLELKEYNEIVITCTKIKEQLNSLKKSELPLIENII